MVSKNFWNGRRVLVTGHTGFKGAWLSIWLNSVGAKVFGYAMPGKTERELFNAAKVGACVTSTYGDIRDQTQLVAAVNLAKPEVVFHLAAQSLVRPSYADPVDTYSTNVMGVVHMLEAVRQCSSVRAVLVVTSDKCYENREWLWGYREDEPMGGYDPYSSSKGCAELVTAAYRSSYFNPQQYEKHGVAIATARAGNVIGGGDWAEDRLIPDFMRAIIAGRDLSVRAPQAIRPWQHVLEPLEGYISLAERLLNSGPTFAESWNFGPHDHDAKPVSWIVENLVKLWGEGTSWQSDNSVHPHEAHYLKLDISKARARLGWAPRWSLVQALERVVEWYRAQNDGKDMHAICQAQIKAYEAAGV